MTIFTPEQNAVLLRDLRPGRVAKRRMGGKDLSYMEAYEIRAHLIRMFGFGGFDIETLSCDEVYQRDVTVGADKKPGWEVAYKAHVRLRIRGQFDDRGCTYAEVAIGSATGSVGLGDLHDNAAKSAVSDAMKRCAINLGTQFGLSLYESGRLSDIVRMGPGITGVEPEVRGEEAQKRLEESLGAQVVAQEDTTTNETAPVEDPPSDGDGVPVTTGLTDDTEGGTDHG